MNDLITFKNIINEETMYTKLITALLEHGMFRAEHYPQYLEGMANLVGMNDLLNYMGKTYSSIYSS